MKMNSKGGSPHYLHFETAIQRSTSLHSHPRSRSRPRCLASQKALVCTFHRSIQSAPGSRVRRRRRQINPGSVRVNTYTCARGYRMHNLDISSPTMCHRCWHCVRSRQRNSSATCALPCRRPPSSCSAEIVDTQKRARISDPNIKIDVVL
jgi:hypothetical protein